MTTVTTTHNRRDMSYYADSATLIMVYGDSDLLERLEPDGVRVIWLFSPRGQPCLCLLAS